MRHFKAVLLRQARWSVWIWVMALTPGVWAQSYTLDWWTVDGGGGKAAATPYTVDFTTGQPDAGAAVGGQYAMTSGFWAVMSTAVQPTPLPTATFTETPIPTSTGTPTASETSTPTPSATQTKTTTPSETATATESPSPTSSATATSVSVPAPGGDGYAWPGSWAALILALGWMALRRGRNESRSTRGFKEIRR